MKRVWNVCCVQGASDESYTYPECAICTNKLSEACPSCETHDTDHFFAYAKSVWETLLMGRKRRESLLSTIDSLAIDKIFRFVLQDFTEVRESTCRVYHLHCGHVYHAHCLDKWVVRRRTCPLDNRPCIVPTKESSKRRKPISGILVHHEEGNLPQNKYSKLMDFIGACSRPVSRKRLLRAFPTYQPRSIDEAVCNLVIHGSIWREGDGYMSF